MSQVPPQPSGPPHLPVQLGAHVPHTVKTGPKHVVPLEHVDAHVPPQPLGPPHLPAQVGLQAAPSSCGDGSGPPALLVGEHAETTIAASRNAPNAGVFMTDSPRA
jgi:hypothetical protein